MSINWISCRRVKVQEIDKRGQPIGKPAYGVMVSDNFVQGYTDIYPTLKALNANIARHGMIALVQDDMCDFDVDITDPRWKDNYAGVKHEASK